MQKKRFLERLPLFAGGCASTQAMLYPQPTPQAQSHLTPAPLVPRLELLVIGVIILAIISFIILGLKENKAKGKKRK